MFTDSIRPSSLAQTASSLEAPRRSYKFAVVLALVVLCNALLPSLFTQAPNTALADDTDLLRFSTAKPYVFVLLDTSSSMNLTPGNDWVHGNADDPRSKLFQAKWALYQVFKDVDDVHMGFASFPNQDTMRIQAKHWLYFATSDLPNAWPIGYPLAETDGAIIGTGADGEIELELDAGDLMTFGYHFPAYESSGVATAGTCSVPLDVNRDREKINRFAKLDDSGVGETRIWIEQQNKTYLMRVTSPSTIPEDANNDGVDDTNSTGLGDPEMWVQLDLFRFQNCNGLGSLSTILAGAPDASERVKLARGFDFLLYDKDLGASGGKKLDTENEAGWWDYQDVIGDATCSSQAPFSGKGWEGNYDNDPPNTGDNTFDKETSDVDEFCNGPGGNSDCYTLKRPTALSSYGRAMDTGDVLPLHWSVPNKDEFLSRLVPNHPTPGVFGYSTSPYFENVPSDLGYNHLQYNSSRDRPLVAFGESPLAKAINDFRCWYLSSKTPGGKCNNRTYTTGWEEIALANDSDWGCRRPFLIIITDGENSCTGGESPTADVANLNSKAGIQTWVVNFGGGNGGQLNSIVQSGKGELVNAATRDELRDALNTILGEIREEVRTFASAAVPTVQATAEDKIYLTNFTPLNSKSVWDGHINAFLKPLPVTVDGRPDITSDRFLWDAGAEMLAQSEGLGLAADQRRVFFSQQGEAGTWGTLRRPFANTTDAAANQELWDLLGFGGMAAADAQIETQKVLNFIYSTKMHTLTNADGTTTDIEYVLGDVFHSNPTVIGNPANTVFFANDHEDYRDFATTHSTRRKLLAVGANDGMLHVFDAGIIREQPDGELLYDDGTGRELFAYVPRSMVPTIGSLASGTTHKWGVDGSVRAADVHIDPVFSTTPDPDEREWRTVLIGGMREGGRAYYALDITQPDKFDGSIPEPLTANYKGSPAAEDQVDDYVPSCLGTASATVVEADCGPIAFGAALWEFEDKIEDITGDLIELDEDRDGNHDLGESWSTPNLGRILVCTDSSGCDPSDSPTKVEERYVMVIGGGLDPLKNNATGDFIYMIDIETGEILYKRKVQGSIPAEVAAVDTDQDGFLDRIYAATTLGNLYRIDLTADSSGDYPEVKNTTVYDINGDAYTVPRIDTNEWVPREIFDAGGRTIYFRPSVIFIARLGLYAIAIGTGDREDLWQPTSQTGRFYVFVDDSDEYTGTLPYTESNFNMVDLNVASVTDEYLFETTIGGRGWYIPLNTDERVITPAFALSGVTIFSTFEPEVQVSGVKNPECSKVGESRVFVVDTISGNSLLYDVSGNQVRYNVIDNFVTEPFAELGQTKNPVTGASGSTADDLTPQLEQVLEQLKQLFPSNCRFSNFRIDIKTVAADTTMNFIAPVPVCIVERNWKEQ